MSTDLYVQVLLHMSQSVSQVVDPTCISTGNDKMVILLNLFLILINYSRSLLMHVYLTNPNACTCTCSSGPKPCTSWWKVQVIEAHRNRWNTCTVCMLRWHSECFPPVPVFLIAMCSTWSLYDLTLTISINVHVHFQDYSPSWGSE